ncbi:hypothetical protein C2845_PM08G06640 [Panicum miliaceum]|uniref:Uncharacterized protein n=1 Tax=Panicum miliaceum TaxID=4540 RepID=A0A3L6QYG4_PANMI|nr:hypothetical protein C2845_PM08G06640 [Panicum miliaceum]
MASAPAAATCSAPRTQQRISLERAPNPSDICKARQKLGGRGHHMLDPRSHTRAPDLPGGKREREKEEGQPAAGSGMGRRRRRGRDPRAPPRMHTGRPRRITINKCDITSHQQRNKATIKYHAYLPASSSMYR